MSNVFSLDALRAEVDEEFVPFKVTLADGSEVVLRSLIRLSDKTREAVLAALDALKGTQGDSEGESTGVDKMAEAATKIVELVADSNGKKLVREIDGDLATLLHVIKKWMETTQLGEAENSPA
jgi:hypothetical protein